jgi:SAM-dependent methyltransferase
MSDQAARAIIQKAMNDPTAYRDMADRENAVWSKILPSLEVSDEREKDAAASRKLKIHEQMSSFVRETKARKLHFKRGLTLGCGAGRLERSIMDHGLCDSFHGIDIADAAVEDARRQAAAKKYAITYSTGDLNSVELPPGEYDLVVTQTSLHHVVQLEHVADQIAKTLTPEGYLWIHDYVGETQAQYDETRLELVNGILALLPEKLRHNRVSRRLIAEIKRPLPGRLGSPFEMIRSGEIVGVFLDRFDLEWRKEWSTILHLIAPPGHRSAYVENEDTEALYQVIACVDQFLQRQGVLTPTGGQYLLRHRRPHSE